VDHLIDSTFHNLLPWCNRFVLLNEKPLMNAVSDAYDKAKREHRPEARLGAWSVHRVTSLLLEIAKTTADPSTSLRFAQDDSFNWS
jgi:hypothetical protein